MKKFSNKEAIFIIVNLCSNISILIADQIIVDSCYSSSILNSIFISILALVITTIICILYKKFVGINLLDIAEFIGGKFLKFIIGIFFLIYVMFSMAVLLCKLTNCLQIVYYSMTDIVYILLSFIIATGFICRLSNNAFSKSNLIVTSVSLIAIFLVFIANTNNYIYNNIFPILGNSINSTFIDGATNLFTFGGIVYLYFLPPKLNDPKDSFKVSISGILIFSIFLVISVTTITLMFNPKLVKGQLFPIYTSIKYIDFGTFFERLDSVFLLIRVMNLGSFLGVSMSLCMEILKNILNVTDDKPLIYPLLLLLFSICISLEKISKFDILENNLFKIIFFSIVISLGIFILILGNIKKIFVKNKVYR